MAGVYLSGCTELDVLQLKVGNRKKINIFNLGGLIATQKLLRFPSSYFVETARKVVI